MLIEVGCDTSRPRQEIIYGGCKIKRPLRERAKRNYALVAGNDVKLCIPCAREGPRTLYKVEITKDKLSVKRL